MIQRVSFLLLLSMAAQLQCLYDDYDSYGHSYTPEHTTFTFKDLAGTIPQDIKDIVAYIENADKYKEMGARMPKGILLVGPPGTGKTSIARAIAGQADATFYSTSASSFVTIWQGSGPSNVKKLFETARYEQQMDGKRVIIFIDEIDAVVGRDSAALASQEERNTLNELLNQMDGMQQDAEIFVLAATNRPIDLDKALKRPGRFDRIVEVGLPDLASRKAILNLYVKKIKHTNIPVDDIAAKTKGWSAAELENLVNEAAIHAVRSRSRTTNTAHFHEVYEKLSKARTY